MAIETWRNCELAVDSRLSLAEGPVWEARRRALLWVSILDGDVHSWSPEKGARETWNVGQPVGAVAPTDTGSLLLAMKDGFGLLDRGNGTVTLVASVEGDRPDQRMNDGKCDPAGRFWAGTMSTGDPVEGSGTLYRYEAGGKPAAMLSGVTISNGLGWSPDGTAMYFVDTPTRSISRFDFDVASGEISNRRTHVEIPSVLGYPDGLCMDEEGCVWLALWGSGRVNRYSPRGQHIGTIELPVRAPSSCAFGGDGLATLFITTARLTLTPDELEREPTSGGVYGVDVGARGCPIPEFPIPAHR